MVFRAILFALATAAVIGGLAYWLKCLCLCDYENACDYKQRNNCNQCKANREYVKEFGEKKQKGRHASAKRGARTELQLMEDDYGFVEGI